MSSLGVCSLSSNQHNFKKKASKSQQYLSPSLFELQLTKIQLINNQYVISKSLFLITFDSLKNQNHEIQTKPV
jgi:hypothetical protein